MLLALEHGLIQLNNSKKRKYSILKTSNNIMCGRLKTSNVMCQNQKELRKQLPT